MRKFLLTAIVVVLAAVPGFGQVSQLPTQVPGAGLALCGASAAVRSFAGLTIQDIRTFALAASENQAVSTAGNERRRGHKPLWAMTAIDGVTAVMDVEATQHCIKIGTCYEANPFMPQSRWGQYAAKGGYTFGFTMFGLALRKMENARVRRFWWVPQAALAGLNLYGFSTAWQYRKLQLR